MTKYRTLIGHQNEDGEIMEELTLEKIHCYILVGRANNRLNIEETLTAEGLQNLLTLNWDAVNPIKETGK